MKELPSIVNAGFFHSVARGMRGVELKIVLQFFRGLRRSTGFYPRLFN